RLAWRALTAATAEGRRALGVADASLGIRPGAPADLVAVDVTDLAALGVPPLEAIVGQAHPGWVDAVWVGGRQVVAGGRHLRREAIVRALADAQSS
ncbi:MAG: amidohydrolase family protein, partial [Myxococcota bacterium]